MSDTITLNDPNPIERRHLLVVAVEVRSVYGCDKIYPSNRPAELFAQLAGTKTLSPADLLTIQALGFEVAEIHKRKLPL